MTSGLATYPRVGHRKTSSKSPTFRRDIQGLRAIAVLVVFLDHMLGWPSGGFVGVDMFFVISGFVITGTLLREYTRSGHISAGGFYARRVKRIMPAATLVLAVTVIVAFLVFTAQRAASVLWDSVAAFFFVSNWRFAAVGTDYFQQGGAVSPLQHYWSLSVEEQFYFVWPWLLLGLLVIFARGARQTDRVTRIVAGTTITAVSAASFYWAILQSVSSPTAAYFSTLTRGWELGLGALLAIIAPLFMRIHGAVRTVFAYVGIAGMVASCFVITPTTVWPAPWALLPTLSTALVIASGIGTEARFIWPITNPIAVYVGDISYSLYLWHFPVIVFGKALFPDAGIVVNFGIAIAGFGLAAAAYHAIEKPIWKSPLWSDNGGRRAWRDWRHEFAPQARSGALIGLGIATFTLVALALAPTLAPARPAPYIAATDSFGPSPSATQLNARQSVEREVAEATALTSWPKLTPSIEQIGPGSKVAPWVSDGCLTFERNTSDDPATKAAQCVYGDPNAPKKIVLWGDSVGISWTPALQTAVASGGWSIHLLTARECPVSDVEVTGAGGAPYPECDTYREFAINTIRDLAPDLLITAQASTTIERLASGGDATSIRDGYITSLQKVSDSVGSVVALGAPPPTQAIENCYTSAGRPSDCMGGIEQRHAAVSQALASLGQSFGEKVKYVNTDDLFCSGEQCPVEAAGIIMRADTAHLTQEYSEHLGPAIGEIIGIASPNT
ncbi:acyltransferase family protein [Microbacterium sp. PM5]|uniref:acyltransferase family protein n=1 Tax=Microbacterium sp. PM5 TaxID=2014534 RepID=UPI000DD12B17|nr:acyltransferase family protein [Microbacterium sp. PM5]AXA95475.1 acyltransferase [Microbacterium sp. PM5]